MTIKLTAIHVYPLKSTTGVALDTAIAERCGFSHDRRWMVVDAKNKTLTQREHPRLALIQVQLDAGGGLVLRAEQMPALTLPLPATDATRREVVIWDDRVMAVHLSQRADLWLSRFLDSECHLVYLPDDVKRPLKPEYAHPGDHVSFADGFPYLLISTESLDDLNARLSEPVPMNRFRPNLVVTGGGPFAEDDWRRIRIANVVFRVVKPCSRCSVVTVDQKSGQQGEEPLRSLGSYRLRDGEVCFGMNLVAMNPGRLRVGEELCVLE